MHDRRISRKDLLHQITHSYQHKDYQEDEQVGIAEHHDKLGNGIIRHYLRKHIRLMYPTEYIILCCQLDPNRIHTILRNYPDIRNNQKTVLHDCERIDGKMVDEFLRLLLDKHQRICCHLEIVAIGIMMRRRKRNRIALAITVFHQCCMLSLRNMTVITTGYKEKHKDHQHALEDILTAFSHIG